MNLLITAIIVDDEKIIRQGLRKMIGDHCPQIQVIGEADNGEAALALTQEARPDIAIVDIRMHRMNGLEYIAEAKKQGLSTRMVILSGYADFSYAQQGMALGCFGYLLKPVQNEELVSLLDQLVNTITAQRQNQKLLDQAKSMEQLRQLAVDASASDGSPNALVHNAIRYVEKQMAKPISVNEVADHLGISGSYLSTLFRKETGMTLTGFITQCKMEKACAMLEQTNKKIYEVGEALGYTDVKHFCKVFRKSIGCTPSEYRERKLVPKKDARLQ